MQIKIKNHPHPCVPSKDNTRAQIPTRTGEVEFYIFYATHFQFLSPVAR